MQRSNSGVPSFIHIAGARVAFLTNNFALKPIPCPDFGTSGPGASPSTLVPVRLEDIAKSSVTALEGREYRGIEVRRHGALVAHGDDLDRFILRERRPVGTL